MLCKKLVIGALALSAMVWSFEGWAAAAADKDQFAPVRKFRVQIESGSASVATAWESIAGGSDKDPRWKMVGFAVEKGKGLIEQVEEVDVLDLTIQRGIVLHRHPAVIRTRERSPKATKGWPTSRIYGVCHAKDQVTEAIEDIAKQLGADAREKENTPLHSRLNGVTPGPSIIIIPPSRREKGLKRVALYSFVRKAELEGRGWKVPEGRTVQEARAILDETIARAQKEGIGPRIRHVRDAIGNLGLGLRQETKVSASAILELLCEDDKVSKVKKGLKEAFFPYRPRPQQAQQLESISVEQKFLKESYQPER